MPLFDRYLIVDWSASNTPKTGRDSIWLCLAERTGQAVKQCVLENPPTRAQAMVRIADLFRSALNDGKRLFAGFDFAFGYPAGGAAKICGRGNWKALWERLAALIEDQDNNRSNRFAVAATLNRENFADHDGPFWGMPHQHKGRYPGLEANRPSYDSPCEKRLVEARLASAQPVWKLAYTGSVGSQSLLGIPRLHALRLAFGANLEVWPFETDFNTKLGAPVAVAEVYPSILPVEVNSQTVKDAAQVQTMAMHFAKLDAGDTFFDWLGKPADMTSAERSIIVREEGWIVGAGHR